jgi:hypothetical protein
MNEISRFHQVRYSEHKNDSKTFVTGTIFVLSTFCMQDRSTYILIIIQFEIVGLFERQLTVITHKTFSHIKLKYKDIRRIKM